MSKETKNDDFRARMEAALQGRVCLMGVGNPAYGDDGLGVRLAEGLIEDGVVDAVVVGTDPGSKYDKAKGLEVPILDEAGFEKLIGLK